MLSASLTLASLSIYICILENAGRHVLKIEILRKSELTECMLISTVLMIFNMLLKGTPCQKGDVSEIGYLLPLILSYLTFTGCVKTTLARPVNAHQVVSKHVWGL